MAAQMLGMMAIKKLLGKDKKGKPKPEEPGDSSEPGGGEPYSGGDVQTPTSKKKRPATRPMKKKRTLLGGVGSSLGGTTGY